MHLCDNYFQSLSAVRIVRPTIRARRTGRIAARRSIFDPLDDSSGEPEKMKRIGQSAIDL
jgi:hypothetical protein